MLEKSEEKKYEIEDIEILKRKFIQLKKILTFCKIIFLRKLAKEKFKDNLCIRVCTNGRFIKEYNYF